MRAFNLRLRRVGRSCSRLVAASAFALSCAALGAQPTTTAVRPPQQVQLASLDTRGGQPVVLNGWWYVAADESFVTPTGALRPAMVLLHGCGGPFSEGTRRLSVRMREYAALLTSWGVHVLITDSLTPRGEVELCTQPLGRRQVTQTHRRRDAWAALQWLASQPGVDASRLGLLGWSNGGSTVLAATNATVTEVAQQGVRPSLAVAYYPGCADDQRLGYRPTAPLLMMVGALDDWTPPQPCEELARRWPEGAPRLDFVSYPGAYHGFDGTAPVRHRADVPNGVVPGAGVHLGGHPPSREASRQRLRAFLDQQWRLP